MPITTRPVKIGLVQHTCTADAAANTQRAIDGIRKAAAGGAQIVCLQELFRSLYFCQCEDASLFDLAEPIPGPTTDTLGALAKELGVVIVSSLFERRAAGLYHNTATVHDADGSLLGIYRKMHIPDDPNYYEKFYFTPGDTGFRAWKTKFGTIGVLVCWDQWFPEGARLTAMKGAEILFYPTAIGWLPQDKPQFGKAQHDSWEVSMRGHAVANGVHVVAVNRCGLEGEIEMWGQSFVADPSGQVIFRASSGSEETAVVEIDLAHTERQRRGWPFLRDRRIDAYEGLLKRYLDRE